MVKLNTSEYLKATDIQGETIVQFIDEGKYVASQFTDDAGNKKQNFNITISIAGDEKTWTANLTSQRKIGEVYGTNTETWVGKSAKLKVIEQMVSGKLKDVIYGEAAEDVAPVAPAEAPPEGWAE